MSDIDIAQLARRSGVRASAFSIIVILLSPYVDQPARELFPTRCYQSDRHRMIETVN